MAKAQRKVGFVLGLALFALFILLWRDVTRPAMGPVAGVAALMAVWWITEAIPIPATALLPVVFFPLLSVMSGKDVSTLYFNSYIFLFMGGFVVALALERWQLHRRIALSLIALIGSQPRQIVFGFMCATAILSMWISNTATTMMMMPIAMSVIQVVRHKKEGDELAPGNEVIVLRRLDNFSITLMLAIAYSASTGGVTTIIGTPPNVVFAGIYEAQFPAATPVSFIQWFAMALPLSITFLLIAWIVLTYLLYPTGRERFFAGGEVIRRERQKLGRMSKAEWRVLFVFVATVALWIFRKNIVVGGGPDAFAIPGWSNALGIDTFADDGTVAILMATLLFMIPSGVEKGKPLMDWKTAIKLPWGILLLFGGGFALAGGFTESGLSQWAGERLVFLAQFSPVVLVGGISIMVTFLTELTSNTATTNMLLPIIAGIAREIDVHPLLLMIPATLSASFAFMLPVATPPNAIVFASGYVPIRKMVLAGIVLNCVGVFLALATVFLFAKPIFSL